MTGIFLFVAGLTVHFFVHEEFTPLPRDKSDPDNGFWKGLQRVVAKKALGSLISVRMVVRLAARTLGPVLPLFIQSLVPASSRVASLAGLISGATAAAGAVGAVTLGRASDRLGYRRVLLTCAILAALLYIPQFFVTVPWQLLVLQCSVGVVMSGVLASVSALLANTAPEGRHGVVFGVDTSAVAMANGIGPMLGASAAAFLGLRAPFLIASAGFAIAALLAWQLIPKPQSSTSPPATS